jgi:peroxiredoxin
MNKKICMLLFVAITCLLLPDFLAFADNLTPLREGSTVPLIQLPTPETSEERNYLGIEEEGFFTIPAIKADVVIIYFFSFYCRFCAMQAGIVNDLYYVIDKDPDLKKKIKLIGIGIGNTPTEVDAFKDANRIPFPLIPDTDFSVHKAYGEIRLPYCFVVTTKEQKVVHCEYAFHDVKNFLKLILKKSGLTE